MLKHSIMTVPYNVTPIGIADKLAESFDRSFLNKDEAKLLESKNIIKLSLAFNETVTLDNKSKNSKGIYIFKPLKNIIKVN